MSADADVPDRTAETAETETTDTVEFLDSTPLLSDPAALRRRAEEWGYLFFRGLLPRSRVLDLRRRILQIVAGYGWLVEGTELMDGIADRAAFEAVPRERIDFCGVGIPVEAYQDVQRLEQFHALAHDPALLNLYTALFGRPALPHPRNIARVMIPGAATVPTPPHQDFIHIQGTPNVWTAWFPVGDCPVELGGLSVLTRSHRDGVLSYKRNAGAGGLEAYLCDVQTPWATSALHAGDVLTFSSQTVHRSLPNRLGDRVRLSCDYRYQPADEDITDGSLRVHCDVLDWDEVYAGWSDRTPTYYWRRHALRMSEWDESVRWQKTKIC